MIEEVYCSFEVSKLLKEKGFDGRCRAAYTNYGKIFTTQIQQYITNILCSKGKMWECTAPTHQMAMKWLREVHKLTFIISPQWAEGDMRNPCRWYWEIRGLDDINIDVYNNPLCNTYEEAVEAASKYSLENLI